MSTLLLWRHAKSSWDDPMLDDHDRPLAPRGVKAARLMASHVSASGLSPALVLCSSARRTRDTLAALRPTLAETCEVQIDERLYGATSSAILAVLRGADPGVPSVMVLGHNPGLEDLALMLAGDGERNALAQLRTKFPTGALAVLRLGHVTWAELTAGSAYLSELTLPRQITS
jgi:phosphohistidine phosphatase